MTNALETLSTRFEELMTNSVESGQTQNELLYAMDRFAPTDALESSLFAHLNDAELNVFASFVSRILLASGKQNFVSNGSETLSYGLKLRFKCKRHGAREELTGARRVRSAESVRCGCNGAFSLSSQGFVTRPHVDVCEPFEAVSGAHDLKKVLGPSICAELEQCALSKVVANRGAHRIDVKKDVEALLKTLAAAASIELPAVIPDSFYDGFFEKAVMTRSGNVQPKDQLHALVTKVESEAFKQKHLATPSATRASSIRRIPAAGAAGADHITAVTWSYPLNEHVALHRGAIRILLMDVTFIGDKRSGMEKVSTVSSFDVAHRAHMIASSVLDEETYVNFEHEALFVKEILGDLLGPPKSLVIITDQDMGRIRAVRKVFGPEARIYLCLWHKRLNFESKVGRAAKISKRQYETRAA